MGDDLGVGLGVEDKAGGLELALQLAVVLDDAVVDQRQALRRMRMGIRLGRRPVGGPAGVADAGMPVKRRPLEPLLEVPELAGGPPAHQVAILQRGDAGRIVAAVFEPLQRVDELRCDGTVPENSDDAAHAG